MAGVQSAMARYGAGANPAGLLATASGAATAVCRICRSEPEWSQPYELWSKLLIYSLVAV